MNQIINVICFTANGCKVAKSIIEQLDEIKVNGYYKGQTEDFDGYKDSLSLYEGDISAFAKESFESFVPLVVIGATGIAVRMIAPFVQNKLQDIPVVVIDELGTFVIPILSGHVGAGNELCYRLSKALGAVPVVTSATDINDKFAVDVFARENGLTIVNKNGIKKVSRKVLDDKPLTLCIKDSASLAKVDILIADEVDGLDATLHLKPKRYVLGIGLRRGKSFAELDSFVTDALSQHGIVIDDIAAVASIEDKKDEEAIISLASKLHVPFVTFDATSLMKVQGDFASSEFVLNTVGADNVCERSCMLAAGDGAELVITKTTRNGMSMAVSVRN